MNFKLMLAPALALGLVSSAQALHVTSLPGSTTHDFGNGFYYGTGPVTVAPGITWSATANSAYGWNGTALFGTNGQWNAYNFIALFGFGSPDSMRLSFATPVAGVGAFFNYAPFNGSDAIKIYDSSNNLLESYSFTFGPFGSSAFNQGEFHGFQRTSADISYMTIEGYFPAAANLQVLASPSAVPEPSVYALALSGLAGLWAAGRRRRQQPTASS